MQRCFFGWDGEGSIQRPSRPVCNIMHPAPHGTAAMPPRRGDLDVQTCRVADCSDWCSPVDPQDDQRHWH